MKLVSRIQFCAFIGLVYIALGDRVLPENYGTHSTRIRADINQYLLGMFPEDRLEVFCLTLSSLSSGNIPKRY